MFVSRDLVSVFVSRDHVCVRVRVRIRACVCVFVCVKRERGGGGDVACSRLG